MKTKKVEKVITALKDRIRHLLKRHFAEISTSVNNLKLPYSQRSLHGRVDKSEYSVILYCHR